MKNGDHIYLRSTSVQAILKKVPHWIVRWGTVLIVAGVSILFLIAYLIRVPETLNVPIQFSFDDKSASVVFEEKESIDANVEDSLLLVAKFPILKTYYSQIKTKSSLMIQYVDPVSGELEHREFSIIDVSVDPASDYLTIYACLDFVRPTGYSFLNIQWVDDSSLIVIDNSRLLSKILGLF